MHEQAGDLWTWPAQYRVVTTNGVVKENGELVMGAGVALEAKKRFPGLPAKLGKWVLEYGNRPFICKQEGIITFPTKHNWRDLSHPLLITESTERLVEIADKYLILHVVLPRPGCGNGGLTWDFVRPILAERLDHRFTVISEE